MHEHESVRSKVVAANGALELIFLLRLHLAEAVVADGQVMAGHQDHIARVGHANAALDSHLFGARNLIFLLLDGFQQVLDSILPLHLLVRLVRLAKQRQKDDEGETSTQIHGTPRVLYLQVEVLGGLNYTTSNNCGQLRHFYGLCGRVVAEPAEARQRCSFEKLHADHLVCGRFLVCKVKVFSRRRLLLGQVPGAKVGIGPHLEHITLVILHIFEVSLDGSSNKIIVDQVEAWLRTSVLHVTHVARGAKTRCEEHVFVDHLGNRSLRVYVLHIFDHLTVLHFRIVSQHEARDERELPLALLAKPANIGDFTRHLWLSRLWLVAD